MVDKSYPGARSAPTWASHIVRAEMCPSEVTKIVKSALMSLAESNQSVAENGQSSVPNVGRLRTS